jgi:hypothetical protein
VSQDKTMSKYDDLLEEARTKSEAFRSTAYEYIPKMYQALRNENPNTTAQDARDRIEKDCVGIWSKRTILDALPNEAKDQKKQKAGRLRQKEANSAAVSAAPSSPDNKKKKKEIIIDTQGKPIENGITPTAAPTTDLMSTIDGDTCPSDNNDNQLQNNEDLLPFEFCLPLNDVAGYVLYPSPDEKESKDNNIWFNGMVDKRTGKVISAAIGRITSQQRTIT